MSTDIAELKARICDALASRKPLTEPLPPVLTATVLNSRLGPLTATTLKLEVWQRFQAQESPSGDDSAALQNLRLATQWLFVSDAQGAYDYLHQAIEKAIIAGSGECCVSALIALIIASCDLNRPDESIAAALEVLKFLEQYKVPGALEALCSNLAITLNRLSAFELACELSAYGVQVALDHDNETTLAPTLNQLSDAYRMSGYHKEALQFANLAYEASEFAPPYLRASIEIGYASALYRVGRLEKALDVCSRAYDRTMEIIDHQNAYRALQLKGVIHHARGEVNAALEAFHRAGDLASQIGLLYFQAASLLSLGHLYLDLNDPETALSYLRNAIRVGKQIGSFSFEGPEMVLVAVCYRKMGKIEQAEKALKTLVRIFQATQDVGLLALCLLELGEIYWKQGNLDEALDYFLEADHAAELLNLEVHHLRVPLWLKLASLYKDRQERTAAKDTLKRVDEAYPEKLPSLLLPEYYLVRSWLDETKGLEAVRATLYKGVDELQRLRNNLPQAIVRQMEGLVDSETLFDILIELETDRLPPTDLYMLCQRARARRLIDLFSKSELQLPPHIEPELVQREQSLLAALRERVADLLDPEETYWEAIDQAEYESLLAELRGLWDHIYEKAPAYVLMRQGAVLDLAQLTQIIYK